MSEELQRDAGLTPSSEAAKREALKLSEALQLCQRELAQVRVAQEMLLEQHMHLQDQVAAAAAADASRQLANALAQHLSRSFWEQQQPTERISLRRFVLSRWPRLGRFIVERGRGPAHAELAQLRLIEASGLFQPDWYLQNNTDVAVAGISPAVHYLQTGAQEGRDPGPGFNTRGYLDAHPDVARGGINPLLHYLSSRQKNAG